MWVGAGSVVPGISVDAGECVHGRLADVEVIARVGVELPERIVEGRPELLSGSEFDLVQAGAAEGLLDLRGVALMDERDE